MLSKSNEGEVSIEFLAKLIVGLIAVTIILGIILRVFGVV